MKTLLQSIIALLFFSISILTNHSAYGVALCVASSSTNTSGTLTDSGGTTGNYSNLEGCNFLISPVGVTSITLTFSSFSLENSYDFLTIYDGATSTSPVLASNLTGTSLPSSVTSTGGNMLIVFSSDSSNTSSGFISTWTTTTSASCVKRIISDEFNLSTYNQNNGTQDWSGDWLEIGESDGPGAGISRVRNDLCTTGRCLRLGVPTGLSQRTYANHGVSRQVDLSSALSAQLSFVYRIGVIEGNQTVVVSISNDGGSSWTDLQRFFMSSTFFSPRTASFDISAFTADNTQIRFLASGNNAVIGMYIDNVKVSYEPSCAIPAVHHYEINHDGQGLTCDTETVEINACLSANCSNLSTQSVSLDFLADGVLVEAPTFIGTTSIDVNHTIAETLTYSIANASVNASNALVCDDSSGDSCDMIFADTGFRFLVNDSPINIPTQLSGKPSNLGYSASDLSLQAIQISPVTGACEAALINSTAIELVAKCINPIACQSNKVKINSTNINTKNDAASLSPYTQVNLDFGSASNNAADFTFTYPDAGKIKLHARYNIPVNGSPSGVYMMGSSNSFVVRPFGFYIEAVGNPEAKLATDDVYRKAGEKFVTKVAAIQWEAADDNLNNDGIPDNDSNLSDNEVTLNFGNETVPEQVTLVHRLKAPAGGSGGLLSGNTVTTFSAGKGQTDQLSWSEVGIIDLTAKLSSSPYLDANSVTGSIPYVGRFIPDYFGQTITKASVGVTSDEGILTVNHNNTPSVCQIRDWAYSGQLTDKGSLSMEGSIRYSIPPKLTIKAYNSDSNVTKNYTDDFAKLMSLKTDFSNKISFKAPVTTHSNGLTLSAISDVSALGDISTVTGSGVLTYELSEAHRFVYTRNSDSEVGPFQAAFELPFAEFKDSDGVTFKLKNGVPEGYELPSFYQRDAALPSITAFNNTVEIRFGRAVIDNSFGPETSSLPQPLHLQYFTSGGYYAAIDDDICMQWKSDNITLKTITLNKSKTESHGNIGFFDGGSTRDIYLKAPNDAQGKVCVEYTIPSWLQFSWATDASSQCAYETADVDGFFNDNPSAVATFGTFRGNDRIIYWREASN
jgi:MSHA biogenesis protein MshQ